MLSDDLYCRSAGLSMDILSKEQRSRRMSSIRSKGNRSTEWRFRSALVRNGISGWRMHVRALPGVPDFVFPGLNIVIFIDGCFWHGCPKCRRPMPQTNRGYWTSKVKLNRERGDRVNRLLRRKGFKVVRIWEHQVRTRSSLEKLLSKLLAG